ncbi:hypothetical protein KC349_g88 [Hortaea werneckii]|nr:hypothetical protein KC349_g88 [Hortaea werneckii]
MTVQAKPFHFRLWNARHYAHLEDNFAWIGRRLRLHGTRLSSDYIAMRMIDCFKHFRVPFLSSIVTFSASMRRFEATYEPATFRQFEQ